MLRSQFKNIFLPFLFLCVVSSETLGNNVGIPTPVRPPADPETSISVGEERALRGILPSNDKKILKLIAKIEKKIKHRRKKIAENRKKFMKLWRRVDALRNDIKKL